MALVKIYRKYVTERRRLRIDYSRWLEDSEELTDFQVTVNPVETVSPIVLNVAYTDVAHKQLAMFASGGVANTTYTLALVVRTNEGQIKRDDIGLMVK